MSAVTVMRMLLVVVASLLLCSGVSAFDCCDSPTAHLCPRCYTKCASRTTPSLKLRELLAQKYFGQQHVQGTLLEMFEAFETAPGNQMVSFHIAGDNGVGKSYMAQLFAEALFYDPIHSGGFLVLTGTNFQGAYNATLVRQQRESLFNIVVQQLEACPRSLIIVDDVEYIHSSVLLVLQQFMDVGPYVVKKDGKKVYKGQAMLGLISDFGFEGATSANIDPIVLENMVLRHTEELWDLDPKQSQLIQYTFPFKPPSEEELEGLIGYLVTTYIPASERFQRSICRVSLDDQALHWMRQQAQDSYPAENGRGARKWVMKYVVPKIGTTIRTAADTRIHMHISLKANSILYAVRDCVA